jgi:hypothetical protein
VIRALSLLERLECRGMLVLPVQPPCQALDCGSLCLAGALDPERIAGFHQYGACDPPSITLHGVNPIPLFAD